MKLSMLQLLLSALLMLNGLTLVSAEQTPASDQTAELIRVLNQAMLEPCNSAPYLACLGLKQGFCRKQVGLSVDLCNKKFPVRQQGGNQQQFINAFGQCMQTEILSRLNLNDAMLAKCEPVLKASLPKG